jgi:hypothetical protein
MSKFFKEKESVRRYYVYKDSLKIYRDEIMEER